MEAGREGFREMQHRVWDMGQRLDYMMETASTSPSTRAVSLQVSKDLLFHNPLEPSQQLDSWTRIRVSRTRVFMLIFQAQCIHKSSKRQ